MRELVTLPVWVLVLVLLLAAIAAVDRILGPSLRWFLRRRMERAVARLNKRLERPIRPFILLARSDTINRVIYSPEVMGAVQEFARDEGMPEEVAFERARKYAREIVPWFSTAAYFGFATRAAKLLSRSLYNVRLEAHEEDAIRQVDSNATVVFVMNHRSNMDYVLVTYLAAKRSALSYAVGEWARVWPLRSFVQSLGGYFIRRKSSDPLYRRVLARYVQLSTANGVTQAVFPEGGLSLDGRVGQPKLGLLSYVISGFDPEQDRDVVFIPVGLNYDRVLEDKVLTTALTNGQRRFRVAIRKAIWVVLRHLWRRVTGRFQRYGYAAVSFGAPISLRALLKRARSGSVAKDLGTELIAAVREIVPVLPVPLMAAVLGQADCPMTFDELVEENRVLRQRLVAKGAHLHLPGEDLVQESRQAILALDSRGLITEQDGRYVAVAAEKPLLDYYAASILQLLPSNTPKIAHAKT